MSLVVEKHVVQPGNIPVLLRYEADGRRKPAIVIVTGGGRGVAKEWAMKMFPMDGTPFVRVYPDQPQHGERGDCSEIRRNWLRNPVGDYIEPIVIQMRKDVSLIIDYLQGLESVDPDRIGACGWSIGGASVLLAAPRDKRIKAVATWAAAQTPIYMLNAEWRGPKQWRIEALPTREELDRLTKEEHPDTWAALFPPTRLLLLHGDDDQQAPLKLAQRYYDVLRPHYAADPTRLTLEVFPGAGHWPIPETAARMKEWFEQVLV